MSTMLKYSMAGVLSLATTAGTFYSFTPHSGNVALAAGSTRAAGSSTTTANSSGAIMGDLPQHVRAGKKVDIKAAPGYHFEKVSGGDGVTTGTVAVKHGSTVVGYLDEPFVLDANKAMVQVSWDVKGNHAYLDASKVAGAADLVAPVGYSEASKATTAGMSSVNYGYIGIPSNYYYKPSLGTLNDYCTKAPDSYFDADFRGPCARHDLCFAAARGSISAKQVCNNALWANMMSNCDYFYGSWNPMRATCHGVANTYWIAVTAVNP